MQGLIGLVFVIFLILIREMEKSEIRKMYDGNFVSVKKQETEHNGIIPLIYKRIICVFWKGHNYVPVMPRRFRGKKTF